MWSNCGRRCSRPKTSKNKKIFLKFPSSCHWKQTNHHDNVRQNVAVFEQKFSDLLQSEAELFAKRWRHIFVESAIFWMKLQDEIAWVRWNNRWNNRSTLGVHFFNKPALCHLKIIFFELTIQFIHRYWSVSSAFNAGFPFERRLKSVHTLHTSPH